MFRFLAVKVLHLPLSNQFPQKKSSAVALCFCSEEDHLALINRFADQAIEDAYVASERAARRPVIRSFFVVLIGACIIFTLVKPMFFAAPLIALLIIAFLLLRTDLYLTQRWVDPLTFFAFLAMAILLLRALDRPDAVMGTSFLDWVVITISFLFVASAIGFVANTRWFFMSAAIAMPALLLLLGFQSQPLSLPVYLVADVLVLLAFSLFTNWTLDKRAREAFAANRRVEEARAKTEDLLFKVLPPSIADRLKSGEPVADSFTDLTVIFADIVGFSKLAKQLAPAHLVQMLNRFFSLADAAAERHGVEKVKTIGDAYLAVSGGTASADHGAAEAVAFARDLIAVMGKLEAEYGLPIQLRIGIHTGPVIGGVVGSSRLAYDYWGDTMNVASRLESVAKPDGVAASSSTYLQCNDQSDFGGSETVLLKDVGEIEIYRLQSCNGG